MTAISRLSRRSGRSRLAPVNLSPWRREPLPPVHTGAGRPLAWAWTRRTPLVAGALSIALMGALVGGAFRTPVPAEALQPGATFEQTVPGSGTNPGPAGTSESVTRFAVVAGVSPLARSGGWMSPVGTGVTLSVARWSPVGVGAPAGGLALPAGGPAIIADEAGSATGSPGQSQQSGAAGGTTVAAATAYPVVVTRPVGVPSASSVPSVSSASSVPSVSSASFVRSVSSAPSVTLPRAAARVVAAPSAPLTAAQRTAADAAAAAALTAANAKADADLTAANALAAANLTAANAAAAAELTAANAAAAAELTAANAAAAAAATAQAAADAAWATAHP